LNAPTFAFAAATVVAASPAFADEARTDAAARVFREFSRCAEAAIDLRTAYDPRPADLPATTAPDGERTIALDPPLSVGGIELMAWTERKLDLGDLGGLHEWGFASPQAPSAARRGLLDHIENARDLVLKGGFTRIEYYDGARWVTVRKPMPDGRTVPSQFFGAPMRVLAIYADDREGEAITRILCKTTSHGAPGGQPKHATLN
jgi:hypothetical protein